MIAGCATNILNNRFSDKHGFGQDTEDDSATGGEVYLALSELSELETNYHKTPESQKANSTKHTNNSA
jgi:hypothetical protein